MFAVAESQLEKSWFFFGACPFWSPKKARFFSLDVGNIMGISWEYMLGICWDSLWECHGNIMGISLWDSLWDVICCSVFSSGAKLLPYSKNIQCHCLVCGRSIDQQFLFFDHVASIYPLVICYIAIENGHRNSGFSHEKWWIFP